MPPPLPDTFAHLHLHSEYSLLDGGNKISRLVEHVKQLGMDAVAVTDHGNLYGAIEFYTKAKAAGVKPILGIEAYVAPGDRTEKKPNGIADGGFHLVLLAENDTGWRNLLKLSTDSFINGFYYKPRMDKSTLAKWCDGLIAINGHLGSSLAHYLLQFDQSKNLAHWNAAVEEARWHAQTFGVNERNEPRFFIELQRTSVTEQDRLNPHLIRLAQELNLPLVCDNDAHFMLAEDWDAHDSLCCISMGKNKTDQSRLLYSRELYVKSPNAMSALFTDHPEAVANTGRIADRCNVNIDFGSSHLPLVKVVQKGALPELSAESDVTAWFNTFCTCFELQPVDSEEVKTGRDVLKTGCDEALNKLARAGAIWRYGADGITDNIRARLDRELRILADKNISAYFLIVWDFVNWARQQGIPAAARGSGVGTMVGYVLGLSNSCPERYGLLFERFTDPDRSEYPDIDIDICQDGRASVINYVRQKYGHVAQIITFGRLKAKAAIKDVARVNGLSPSEGQRLANLVPNELFITIDAALQKEPDFRAEYDNNPVSRKVIDTARALEDHARHAGVHAAGVVIATQPLDNIVPLSKATGSDDVVTQWDGPTCEKVGLLKMDFLGLRTLSTIELAKRLIRNSLSEEAIAQAVNRTRHLSDESAPGPLAHPLDLDRLTCDDPRVFELFQRADTAGIFQFESGGMRKLLIEMQPDRLEDLIAANALFRPGPMDLIPDYCRRKHRKQPVPSVHPIVDQFTKETYGIMVYQEQVMQIVHSLGGIPLRAAYSLIKAISKKKQKDIDAVRPKFIEGAQQQGLRPQQSNELFELILKFAGYGFNKSHSTGYAIIAYHTAYLKTYFPNHYMAALLTFESGARKVDDWAPLLEECKRVVFPDSTSGRPHVGVQVLPPDINLSQADFSVVYAEGEPHDNLHGHVRFGLSAIKGIGAGAIEATIADRTRSGPFTSIHDFCERISAKSINKAATESLIKCGAFDSVHGATNRAAMAATIDDAMAAGASAAEDARAGQMNFFGGGADTAPAAAKVQRSLPTVKPWSQMEMLKAEKDTLGFHVSGHPLDQHEAILREFSTAVSADFANLKHDAVVVIGGQLTRVRITFVKQGRSAGEKMAMITLSDKYGSIEGVVFSSIFARHGAALTDDAIVMLIGRVDRERGEPQIIVDQALSITDAPRHLAGRIEIDFVEDPTGDPVQTQMQMIAGLLQQAGAAKVADGGKAAEVFLNVQADGRRYTLKSNRLRAVAESSLLQQLRELVGVNHVRVVSGGAPKPRENGNGSARKWNRAPAPELVEA